MKILIATDSFKDALTADAVCQAIERGMNSKFPDVETQSFPLADGGEGTASILAKHTGGKLVETEVHDPLFRKRKAKYAISGDFKTAFIEMAEASGLQLLSKDERNPMDTTTLGTGELVRDALQKGARKIVLGIGGSATNDGGMGLAVALGYKFLDRHGKELKPTGQNLVNVYSIVDSPLKSLIAEAEIVVACDVENLLHGPEGSAMIFGAQKGANNLEVEWLDVGLHHFSKVLFEHFGEPFDCIPGSGAAGGLGAGAMAFLDAGIQSGIELVMETAGFEQQLDGVDWIITGEGKIDSQSAQGKLIQGVVRVATKNEIPVIALCGKLDASEEEVTNMGLKAAFAISNPELALEENMKNASKNLEAWGSKVLEWIKQSK